MALSHTSLIRALEAKNWDRDDIVAEVVTRIHARQSGKSPYDAHKSSIGHWLHMATFGILRNLVALRGPIGDLTDDGVVTAVEGGLGDLLDRPEKPVAVQATRVGQVVRRRS